MGIDLSHFKEILKSRKAWILAIAIIAMKLLGIPDDKIGDVMTYSVPALLVAHGIQNKTGGNK